uniref:Uncharacterized protein n=1 Tax=Arundo donax TaxID=35708 RepID=A0A0A9CRC8_ARUDO
MTGVMFLNQQIIFSFYLLYFLAALQSKSRFLQFMGLIECVHVESQSVQLIFQRFIINWWVIKHHRCHWKELCRLCGTRCSMCLITWLTLIKLCSSKRIIGHWD